MIQVSLQKPLSAVQSLSAPTPFLHTALVLTAYEATYAGRYNSVRFLTKFGRKPAGPCLHSIRRHMSVIMCFVGECSVIHRLVEPCTPSPQCQLEDAVGRTADISRRIQIRLGMRRAKEAERPQRFNPGGVQDYASHDTRDPFKSLLSHR